MARIRTIKPEIALHDGLFDLERETGLPVRFAWAVLPCHCDREGRFKWRPKRLGAQILPYDEIDFSRVLDAWFSRGFLVKYRVGNEWFGTIPTFLLHQVINNREAASVLPGPDDADEIIQAPQEHSDASATRVARVNDATGTPLKHAQGEGKGKEGKGKEGKETSVGQEPDGAVDRIFDHWKTTHSHPKAQLDDKRRRLIRDRLKKYSEADLCQAITGYLNSPHHTGDNPHDTTYDAIDLFMRDSKHVDMGLKFYREPPRVGLSEKTRRNIEATKGWRPPEMRNASN